MIIKFSIFGKFEVQKYDRYVNKRRKKSREKLIKMQQNAYQQAYTIINHAYAEKQYFRPYLVIILNLHRVRVRGSRSGNNLFGTES